MKNCDTKPSHHRLREHGTPPPVTHWLQNGFHRFLNRYLRRQFHAIGLAAASRVETTIVEDEPLIVYVNHPSWWDPLIAHFLNRELFPNRQFYAPIDGKALEQYSVFSKLGFYGVRSDTSRGAADFLRVSRDILATRGTSLWLTPEGRFADVRDRDASLMPGLSHLCHSMSHGTVLPIALEYVFWDEKLPVCLALQGQMIRVAEFANHSKSMWGELLTDRLRTAQDELGQLAIARHSVPFDDLLVGHRGAGGVYDFMRRMKSRLSGKTFQAEHGDQFADSTKDQGN
jgi:1-acyl-sn-glycerol-3-phosphate acyltransferase